MLPKSKFFFFFEKIILYVIIILFISTNAQYYIGHWSQGECSTSPPPLSTPKTATYTMGWMNLYVTAYITNFTALDATFSMRMARVKSSMYLR